MSEISSLQQARDAAGLSVEQISSLTSIRTSVIKDLESNSVNLSGGIAYARGHIRTIARVLNAKTGKAVIIDADLLVKEMEAGQNLDKRTMMQQLAENNVLEVPRERVRIKFSTLATASISILSIGFVAQIAINNVSVTNTVVAPKPVAVKAPAVEAPAVEAKTTTDTLPAGVNLVLIGVSGRSWVGLTNANGEQVFDGQIMAGQIQSFSDPQVLKAVIGNAGAVSIKVNGKDLGVAGSDGQVVRLDFDANKLL
jgi:cytoskeletal protein RodZ